jgi:alkylhydroperoxidase/carboxymuconolactone decarboxylase family protein YurZ
VPKVTTRIRWRRRTRTPDSIIRTPAGLDLWVRREVEDPDDGDSDQPGSVGEVAHSEDLFGAEAHEQFTLNGVAPSEPLSQILAHVAPADSRRERQHLVEVGADRHRSTDRDKRKWWLFVIDADASPSRPPQRSTLDRLCAGIEDKVIAVEHEPNGYDVWSTIAPSRGEFSRACTRSHELPPLSIGHRRHGPIVSAVTSITNVWNHEELARRDRSLITVAALITNGSTEQLRSHLSLARENGLTETEPKEAIIHLAFYAAWPRAMSAITIAKEVFV